MSTEIKGVHFDIGDQSYHALTAGASGAPLLLFLHGFPEFSGAWRGVMAQLSQSYFCVAPDQRGYGASWRPEGVGHYATKHLVADVLAMIEHFGNGRAGALIGHDWGASVAYATAIRAPAKIARLVILNGVHPAPFQAALARGGAQSVASQYIGWLRQEGSETALAKDDFAAMFALFSAKMDMDWLTPELAQDYKTAWRDEAGVRAMVNWYRASPLLVAKPGQPISPDALPKWDPEHLRIRMPHLLIWGMADTALLAESRAGLEDYCDELKVVEMPRQDHWLAHNKPVEIGAEIAAFLKD